MAKNMLSSEMVKKKIENVIIVIWKQLIIASAAAS